MFCWACPLGRERTGRLRAQLLERVGLGNRLKHYPRQLSTGQQQRVAVARAMANRPKLVLADEPTGNLDHKNAAEALALIRTACQENGAALLLVSHDRDVLETIRDRAGAGPNQPGRRARGEAAMTLWLIILRSMRQHALSTIITAMSIALAGGLLMSVWTVKEQSRAAFTGVNGGFDAVLGARGSKLQLVLNSIFHLEASPGNLSAADYLNIKSNRNVALAIPIAVGDNYQGLPAGGNHPGTVREGGIRARQTLRTGAGRQFL